MPRSADRDIPLEFRCAGRGDLEIIAVWKRDLEALTAFVSDLLQSGFDGGGPVTRGGPSRSSAINSAHKVSRSSIMASAAGARRLVGEPFREGGGHALARPPGNARLFTKRV